MTRTRVQVIRTNPPYPAIDVSCPACKTGYTARAWLGHDPADWGREEMRRLAGNWLRTHPCRRKGAA